MPGTPSTRVWIKSSHSGQQDCVQVRDRAPGGVEVRDSKDGERAPVLALGAGAWSGLVGRLAGRG
ncbi:DUF397 domain-containing protein (plasmid) [Embleya sp. NBC_00888]|uniref:DUF397 domain-containing protein n=1 Tax=Embleya sp. NBC_00888 TaxID=2975960 RepID=UPI002F913951|nr:DUF397 domain-containing protein [Embleya sp. NBC_00888]